MCWRSSSKPIKMVAENDIPVQKVLKNLCGSLLSPVYSCVWKIGEVKECEIGKVGFDGWKEFYLGKGFHSCEHIYKKEWNFRNSSDRLLFYTDFSSNECIYDAVIPAGSEYYVNKFGDYVSNRLKIVGRSKC